MPPLQKRRFRIKSRVMAISLRNLVLEKNLRDQAKLNAESFISKLKEYLETHDDLINEAVKFSVGNSLQEKCLEAVDIWGMRLEAKDFPMGYYSLSLPKDLSSGCCPSDVDGYKAAEEMKVMAHQADADAGIDNDDVSHHTNHELTTAEDKRFFIRKVCHTLKSLAAHTTSRRINNFEKLWAGFRIRVLHDTVRAFGIPDKEYQMWFIG